MEFYLINIILQNYSSLLEHQFFKKFRFQEIKCPELDWNTEINHN